MICNQATLLVAEARRCDVESHNRAVHIAKGPKPINEQDVGERTYLGGRLILCVCCERFDGFSAKFENFELGSCRLGVSEICRPKCSDVKLLSNEEAISVGDLAIRVAGGLIVD
jgi:hypothetical protein